MFINLFMFDSIYRLHRFDFEKLAKSIVKVFPNEDRATYFESSSERKGMKGHIGNGGKLYKAYSNYRAMLRKVSVSIPFRNPSKRQAGTPEPPESQETESLEQISGLGEIFIIKEEIMD